MSAQSPQQRPQPSKIFFPHSEVEVLGGAVSRLSKIVILQWVVMALMVVLLGVVFYLSQRVTYFAVTNDGRLTKLQPLSAPVYNRQRVISHGVQAISESFALDFVNYKQTLTNARNFYTKKGFDSLMLALEKSGLTERIEGERLVSSIIYTSTPVLAGEGVDVDGVYKWKIEFPVQFTLRSSNKAVDTKALAVVIIQRVPPEESLDGIAVSALNIKT